MNDVSETNGGDALHRYLLGELPAEERDRLEELYFTDADALERLLAAENELIESYVAGRLPAPVREKFQTNYMTTPERRRRVRVVERLRETAAEEGATAHAAAASVRERAGRHTPEARWRRLFGALFPRGPQARSAFALGALAVVFGSVFLINGTLALRTRLAEAERERAELSRRERETRAELAGERARAEELERLLDAERRAYDEQLAASVGAGSEAGGGESTPTPVARPPVIPTLELGFGGVSTPGVGVASPGARPARLLVPGEAEFVRLRVRTPASGFETYTLTLRGAGDASVLTRAGLTARGVGASRVVTVHVPAATLPPGQYTLVLTGRRADGSAELAGEYSVIIENR